MPGSGAAGGLGFALRAFCNAEQAAWRRSGRAAVGLAGSVEGADWVFTGEVGGFADAQWEDLGRSRRGRERRGRSRDDIRRRIKDGAELLLEHGVLPDREGMILMSRCPRP